VVQPSLSPTPATTSLITIMRSRLDAGPTGRKRPAASVALVLMLLWSVLATPGARAQTYTVLYAFGTNSNDGQGGPIGDLVLDNAGNLYGTTFGTVFQVDAAGKETVLHVFTLSDGYAPHGGLIRDPAGNLYGTTSAGGAHGQGTVFKLTKAGKFRVLYSFVGGSGDGAQPYGGLLRDAAGNLYGTTVSGGSLGTVFEVAPSGKETVLHSFTGSPDGATPLAGLVRDATGNLYGTTKRGGAFNWGTVFKIDAAGKETVLHSFSGYQGRVPMGRLTLDAVGNLYGTADEGTVDHLGSLFKLDPSGKVTVLHRFTGPDGAGPMAGLTRDAAGNLYGTTFFGGDVSCVTGGAVGGCGVVFKRDTKGNLTELYSFPGNEFGPGTNGGLPFTNIVRDSAGNLYGTATSGGDLKCTGGNFLGCGVVFKITLPPARGVR
jgi:uncharacterized repeat protein (TIGR03803 family)